MAREQLAIDVRSRRERAADEARAATGEALDEAVELLEGLGSALELEDEDRLHEQLEAVLAWWRRRQEGT